MLWSPRKQTPFIMQMEGSECGAAALAIILGYFGRYVPLTELRTDCGVSRDGSKASNLVKAARKHGLKAKGLSKDLVSVRSVPTPFIAFWEFKHFLVIEGFGKHQVYVNDPACGHRRVSMKEFERCFTGVILVFEPGPDFRKEGRPPTLLPAIWRRLQGSRAVLVLIVIAGMLATVPNIVHAALVRTIVDHVFMEQRFEWIRPILAVLAIVFIFQVALQYLSNYYIRRIRVGLSAKLQAEFVRHLLHLPYLFYSQRYSGEVIDRGKLNESFVDLVVGQLVGAVVGVFTMCITGLVLFAFSAQLTMICLLFTMANFLLLQLVAHFRLEANMRIAKDLGKLQGATLAALQDIDSIKAAGYDHSFYQKWSGYYATASSSQQDLAIANRWFSGLPAFTNQLIQASMLVVGGIGVIRGSLSFGTLLAFNTLLTSFLQPVNQLLGLSPQMQQIRGNLIRLDDVLGHPTRDTSTGNSPSPGTEIRQSAADAGNRLLGEIECRDLAFGYNPLDAPWIADVNIHVPPGARIALVGESGSGKSTIARLIAGLLQPSSGAVLLDGRLRSEICQEWVNHSVAFVEQEVFLFDGTVRENLALWDETLPNSWIVDACKDACILDDILVLPGGLGAAIDEDGRNFSGGQRQRLEIARALSRNPSIMVLDEATSALDAETEAMVLQNLHRRGCTCVMIAHRLSAIRNCERIIVLEKGRIVEQGSHDELWSRNGVYRKLMSH